MGKLERGTKVQVTIEGEVRNDDSNLVSVETGFGRYTFGKRNPQVNVHVIPPIEPRGITFEDLDGERTAFVYRTEYNALAAVISEAASAAAQLPEDCGDLGMELRAILSQWPWNALMAHDADVLREAARRMEALPTSDPGTVWFNADGAEWLRAEADRIESEIAR